MITKYTQVTGSHQKSIGIIDTRFVPLTQRGYLNNSKHDSNTLLIRSLIKINGTNRYFIHPHCKFIHNRF